MLLQSRDALERELKRLEESNAKLERDYKRFRQREELEQKKVCGSDHLMLLVENHLLLSCCRAWEALLLCKWNSATANKCMCTVCIKCMCTVLYRRSL